MVASTGCRARGWDRHCSEEWRDDDRYRRVGLALGHDLVDGLAVIGAVCRHRGDRISNLPKQRADLRCFTVLVARQLGREGLTRAGIDRKVRLAPCSGAELAVSLDQPLARPVDLQARRVDHHVHRPARLGARQRHGKHHAGAASRERRVAGPADIGAEQGHKRAQQAFGLPIRLNKSQAQQVVGLNRKVCIVARATALAWVGRMLGPQRLRRHPDR